LVNQFRMNSDLVRPASDLLAKVLKSQDPMNRYGFPAWIVGNATVVPTDCSATGADFGMFGKNKTFSKSFTT